MPDYGSLGVKIKAHWARYRPEVHRAIEEAGILNDAVGAAPRKQTVDALYRLTVEQALPYDQAWELIREE